MYGIGNALEVIHDSLEEADEQCGLTVEGYYFNCIVKFLAQMYNQESRWDWLIEPEWDN